MNRRKVRTFQANLKKYDVSYDCSLTDFLKQIEDIVSDIPAEQRDSIMVEWTDGDECDSGYIEFTHYRPETDEEMSARKKQERADALVIARVREAHDRAAYEALKLKFEGK